MSTPPKRPKTVNRLQQLITEWERESGQPVRRLNLRVASMMLAGALRRAVDDDGAVVFVTRGGVAMELRAGEKARVTGDVDLVCAVTPNTCSRISMPPSQTNTRSSPLSATSPNRWNCAHTSAGPG